MLGQDALARLQDATTLWSIRHGTAAEVIEAVCDCLVAGVDSPSLRILAGVSPSASSHELLQWLEPTLDELGLTFFPEGSQEGKDAAVRIMATKLLAGTLSPRELARWAHSVIGHDGTPLAEELVMLDDIYDMLEFCEETEADIDARVLAEARRLTATGDATSAADSTV
ncbi:hypothetical protein [Micromonospora parathelypteridis]|uniref:Uncharacterized protein n=1 Tax=Micromonospora parathelypteridis TaxID=1839617 RepID=A0A840W388_9ACTN|nr:hypothetical protein [Micromonospora parathelypteridis]MBB5477641.1 hypothetical protein [Micromonospora parathelypteridis]GGO10902.1 hypothetical protein GCM10011576_18800 [Micromonospora parathelypteridis]